MQPTPDGEQQDRTELLARARTFLASAQLQSQDVLAKRKFLAEKGLTENEIDRLLLEQYQQIPAVPPRTYPPLAPSNLPNLLIGLVRLFSWLIGGSAALIFIYHRFLLPLVIQSHHARTSLKSHHLSLLRNLSASLSSLKELQAESFSVLPAPQLYKEEPKFASCTSIDDVLSASVSSDVPDAEEQQAKSEPNIHDISTLSLLRCAIQDLNREKENARPSTKDIFCILETKIPWLQSEAAESYQQKLWQTLSTCPLFHESEDDPETCYWTYTPPSPPAPSPLLSSLTSLTTTLSQHSPIRRPVHQDFRQNLLQALTSFTGYLTTQLYSLPNTLNFRAPGMGSSNVFGPAEEELRREIRAFKGLVLNRRSFMSRPASTQPATTSP